MSVVETVEAVLPAEQRPLSEPPAEYLPLHSTNGQISTENHEEPHVEYLADEYSSGGEEVASAVASTSTSEPKKKRKRGARLRYSDDEIAKMREHLKSQMELTPRPSLLEVWSSYALQHPGRTPSALMQEHGRHPELFGPRSSDHPPSVKPKPKPAASTPVDSRYPYPYPPWNDEDTQVLLEFLRQRNQGGSSNWDELNTQSQRRPPQSFRIKYSKNKDLFEAMALGNPIATPQIALDEPPDQPERPAFTWQLPTGALKRPRSPEAPQPSAPRQRRASTSLPKRYVDDSSEERDSDDDYRSGKGKNGGLLRPSRRPGPRQRKSEGDAISNRLLVRLPALTTPKQEISHLPTPRHSVPISQGSTPSLPAWLPEFSPADKAAALKWVITRQRPTDVLHDMESWLEFANNHSEHSAPEWLCYYLVHHPTFEAVESGLGSLTSS